MVIIPAPAKPYTPLNPKPYIHSLYMDACEVQVQLGPVLVLGEDGLQVESLSRGLGLGFRFRL